MEKTCLVCGNIFKVKPSHFDKRVTCGMVCRGELQRQYILSGVINIPKKPRKACVRCNKNHIRKKGLSLCEACHGKVVENNKIVSVECFGCRKVFSRKKIYIKRSKNQYCSRACHLSSLCGSKNPNWKGGIKPLAAQIRSSEKMRLWTSEVLKRDNYKCFYCKRNGSLEAHHIIGFASILESYKFYNGSLNYEGLMEYSPLWDINNGVALCKSCHNGFPKRLPERTIFIPAELKERVLISAVRFVARSPEDVVQNLGMKERF